MRWKTERRLTFIIASHSASGVCLDCPVGDDAGRVDEHVEAAESLDRRLDRAARVRLNRHVGAESRRPRRRASRPARAASFRARGVAPDERDARALRARTAKPSRARCPKSRPSRAPTLPSNSPAIAASLFLSENRSRPSHLSASAPATAPAALMKGCGKTPMRMTKTAQTTSAVWSGAESESGRASASRSPMYIARMKRT